MDRHLDQRLSGTRYAIYYALMVVISVLLVFSRRQDAFTHAQFWAEDGVIWYQNAHEQGGLAPLLLPQNGYYQTISRLIAAASQWLPLRAAPLFFNLCALFFQLLPVWLLFSRRGCRLVPSPVLRLLWAVLYIGHPYSAEVHVNVTNIQWHLAVLVCLLLALEPGVNRSQRGFDLALIALASLSGPFVVFYLALGLICWWHQRSEQLQRYLLVFVVGALLQTSALLTHHGSVDRSSQPLGADFSTFLHIIGGQISLAALYGDHWFAIYSNPHWRLGNGLAAVAALLAAAVFVLGFRYGSLLARLLIVLSVAIFGAALLMPMISLTEPQWPLFAMPGSGQRYSYLPILAFYLSLLCIWQRTGSLWLRGAAIVLLANALILGVIGSWHLAHYPNLHFGRYARSYEQAPIGQPVDIPVPPGADWTIHLIKH